MRDLQEILKDKNIPLVVDTYTGNRFLLAQHLLDDVLPTLKATHVFGNIEYEVDELRRDVETVKLEWAAYLNNNPENLEEYPEPEPNDASLRLENSAFDALFDDERWAIPDEVNGFECRDRELMAKIWPEGTEKALQVLDKFLSGQARHEDLGLVDPLKQYIPEGQSDGATRIKDYASSRNSCDGNSSSRMSPYLASGIVSARMVLNKARGLTNGKLESGRDSGIGIVSMGRPFLEQFSDVQVGEIHMNTLPFLLSPCYSLSQWETDEKKLQAWKDGMTGFPIVDAAQRQASIMGWMHNRPRMICASFLVKDLMLDWRLGGECTPTRV
ncbi:hypothetical protein QFC19_002795 [Naganishia cerealis]|uniref:Uncharacterized protein n=1 Tax=Naganishia cerealis TaxID=610337 RepID=A0ACC2W753_9TREE|nr:hypothetical protein QFC19_002795 [Naganishia cerealis]